jgi:hypothetical protein
MTADHARFIEFSPDTPVSSAMQISIKNVVDALIAIPALGPYPRIGTYEGKDEQGHVFVVGSHREHVANVLDELIIGDKALIANGILDLDGPKI